MWLPAVVGDHKKLFFAASISALVTKILMLIISVILAFLFQEKLHASPFVLWCQSSWSDDVLGGNTLCTFKGTNNTSPCFQVSNITIQKVRQCDADETYTAVVIIAVVVVSNMASLLATLRLNRIISFVELYKASKVLQFCKIPPIVHRAAVVQLIKSDTEEDVKTFKEICQEAETSLSIVVNQPSAGRYPLHVAGERESAWKIVQLLNAGAKVLPDAENKNPKLAWPGFNCWPKGIQHVMESSESGSDVLSLLQSWSWLWSGSAKKKAEQDVLEKFGEGISMLTVPLPPEEEGMARQAVKNVVKKWNSQHTTKCESEMPSATLKKFVDKYVS